MLIFLFIAKPLVLANSLPLKVINHLLNTWPSKWYRKNTVQKQQMDWWDGHTVKALASKVWPLWFLRRKDNETYAWTNSHSGPLTSVHVHTHKHVKQKSRTNSCLTTLQCFFFRYTYLFHFETIPCYVKSQAGLEVGNAPASSLKC